MLPRMKAMEAAPCESITGFAALKLMLIANVACRHGSRGSTLRVPHICKLYLGLGAGPERAGRFFKEGILACRMGLLT